MRLERGVPFPPSPLRPAFNFFRYPPPFCNRQHLSDNHFSNPQLLLLQVLWRQPFSLSASQAHLCCKGRVKWCEDLCEVRDRLREVWSTCVGCAKVAVRFMRDYVRSLRDCVRSVRACMRSVRACVR